MGPIRAAAAALEGAAVWMPSVSTSPWLAVVHLLVGVVAIAAIITGVRRHRPSRTLPWRLFALGIALFVGADVAEIVLPAALLSSQILRTLVSYSGYLPMVVAAVALVRARLPDGDREGLIDAAIIAVAVGMVLWELGSRDSATSALTVTVVLMLGLPIFAMGVRLLFTGGERLASFWCLIASGACRLAASLPILAGAVTDRPVLLEFGVAAFLLLAAAALHPSMRVLTEVAPPRQRLGVARFLLLWAALFVGPTITLVRLALGLDTVVASRPVVIGVLSALVLWRLALLAGELDEAARRSRSLAEASRTMAEASSDYGAVLHRAARVVSELAGDPCAVWIVGEGGRFFEDRAVHHPDPEAARALEEALAVVRPSVDEGFAGMVARGGSAATLTMASEQLERLKDTPYGEYARRWRIASLLGAPLRARGRVLGVLLLARGDLARDYTPRELRLVEELADRAALAIDNARLYQLATSRTVQQAAVSTLGLTALTGLGLPTLLEQAVTTVAETLGVEYAKILELQPDGRDLVVRAGYGWRDGVVGVARVPAGADSQAGYTLHVGESVIVEHLATEERFDACPLLRDHAVVSGASVVIQGWADAFGVLSVHSRSRRAFSREDVAFLQAVANVLAGAIERDRTEREVRHLHDPLTGLPNRALLLDRLDHALARRRPEALQVALLFIDLDNFKLVNDSYGHRAGDQLLVRMVRRLQRLLRSSDTIARLAGDEFVVVCEDVDGRAAAVEIAERITAALEEPFTLDDAEVFASASIGIAVADSPDDHAEALLRRADTAMYQAKRRGGSRHEVFDEELRGRALKRLRLEHDLRGALRRAELHPVYQPLVRLPEGRIVGVETLLRWDHPEYGPIPPDVFIPIAEESGSIIPLGTWVLRVACQQMSRWRAELPLPTPFTLYVNLSGRQLIDPGFVELVAGVLEETGVQARELGLEITETSLLEDPDLALARLGELKRLGVRLAMDDFGTGYSSLSYLRRMPLDVVKVDRSFVKGLGTEAGDSAIVAAVVHMAVALRLDVTAEGVETSQQRSALEELGCELAQGFYFAKPVPPAEIETLIVEHAASAVPGAASPVAGTAS